MKLRTPEEVAQNYKLLLPENAHRSIVDSVRADREEIAKACEEELRHGGGENAADILDELIAALRGAK